VVGFSLNVGGNNETVKQDKNFLIIPTPQEGSAQRKKVAHHNVDVIFIARLSALLLVRITELIKVGTGIWDRRHCNTEKAQWEQQLKVRQLFKLKAQMREIPQQRP